jgi:hypothetical protein
MRSEQVSLLSVVRTRIWIVIRLDGSSFECRIWPPAIPTTERPSERIEYYIVLCIGHRL